MDEAGIPPAEWMETAEDSGFGALLRSGGLGIIIVGSARGSTKFDEHIS